MPQVDQDLIIYQNAAETLTIAVTDDNDVPMDLTTFDSLCWILSRAGQEIVRYTLADPELGIVNVDATDDGLRIVLPPGVTGGLDEGRLYTHQAWATLANAPRPVCIGYVTVLRGDGC